MVNRYGLTKKQKELLDFLREQEGEVSPSFDEMREALGLASKSGIHRLVKGLEDRGYINRIPNRKRTIRLVWDRDNASTQEIATWK